MIIQYIIDGIFGVILVILLFIIINQNSKLVQLKHFVKRFEDRNISVKLANIVEKVESDTDILIEQQYKQEKMLNSMFSKHGIERFNAFGNVEGKLSFSLALLDNSDTGYIMTSIHQDDGSHLFIKEVINGDTYQELSEEEISALNKAKKLIVVNNMEIK